MAATFSRNKTYVTGETITAADRNADQDWVIANVDPDGVGDASADNAEMQATKDPYASDTIQLAGDLREEVKGLRFQVAQLKAKNKTYWYENLPALGELVRYKRPRLIQESATQVSVANNTGTANETTIIFPDGEARSVTEDVSAANKYRKFDITATANFTSGTEDSGLLSGVSDAVNTWYPIYAVKSLIDSSKFVLVGSVTYPTQANFGTLNTAFGTDSWVFLGYIPNGDAGAATGDILSFTQQGPITLLGNSLGAAYVAGGSGGVGINYGYNAASGNISWSYSAGATVGTNLPDTIKMCHWCCATDYSAAKQFNIENSTQARGYLRLASVAGRIQSRLWIPASDGVFISTSVGSEGLSISLVGWIDDALTGPMPLL